MAYQKIYSREHWENFPSEKTAINRNRLNNIEGGIDAIDDRVCALDTTKVDLTKANELVKEILWDESNGTLTVVKMNGSKAVIDTKLEKLAVNFAYDSQKQQLVITLDDGTVQNVDLSSLITEYEFLDSDTIAFEITDGKVKAIVKNGSITEDHLSPDYLGEIRTQVGRAEMSAKSADASEKNAASSSALSKSYAVGGTGTREGEDTDNARYYMEQAKAVSAVDIATTEKAGIVKPDGTTITVDEDGTLHGQSKVDEMTGATADKDGTSGTVPAPTAGQEAHILNGDGTWKSPLDNAIIAAKIQELNKAIEDATALRASLESYGMVKLCDSSAVTDSTGLALPATEKNASIEGTLAAQIASLSTDSIDYYNCNKIYSLDITGNIIPSKLTTRLAISAPCWGSTKYLKIKIRVIGDDLFRPIFSYRLLQDYEGGSRVGILTVSKNYNYARYTDFYNNGSLEIKAGYTSDDYIEVYFKVPSYGVAFVDIDHSDSYSSLYDWEENIKNGNMSISLVDSVGAFTGGEYTLSNGV